MPRVASALVEVWKDRALAAEAREAVLLERYHALKLAGASAQKAPVLPAPVPPPLDPEQRLLEQAERAFVENATAEFEKMGKTPDEARRIADQIRQAVSLHDSPVPFGP